MRITSDLSTDGLAGVDTQKQAKLVDAAQQFEGMLLQEMLKPMQAGQDSWGGEKRNDDAGADTMSSFGTEALAKAISKGGGLGIAKQVIRQVTQERRLSSEKNGL
jgi:flagellar protein FlgJ